LEVRDQRLAGEKSGRKSGKSERPKDKAQILADCEDYADPDKFNLPINRHVLIALASSL
jgi:hypothetical protein